MWDPRKEEKERQRFVAEGLEQRPPVVAVAVIFMGVWLSGWACSAFLLARGMNSIPERYAISTLVSYGFFIFSVGVWCRYWANPHKSRGDTNSPLDAIGDVPGPEDEGCLVVIAVAAVFLLLSGIFWLVGGYAMLFEVAFESAFAGTMVYRMGRRDSLGNWAGTLIRRTWLSALVAGGLLVGTGAKMQHDHPNAKTMSQAIKAHRSMQK